MFAKKPSEPSVRQRQFLPSPSGSGCGIWKRYCFLFPCCCRSSVFAVISLQWQLRQQLNKNGSRTSSALRKRWRWRQEKKDQFFFFHWGYHRIRDRRKNRKLIFQWLSFFVSKTLNSNTSRIASRRFSTQTALKPSDRRGVSCVRTDRGRRPT